MMGARLILCALALGVSMLSAAAAADDPNDRTMNAAAIERDRAIIRRLNQEQLAHVRQRDARYAEGWRNYRNGKGTVSRSDAADYAEARQDYTRKMAAWHRAVAACRAGDRDACDN